MGEVEEMNEGVPPSRLTRILRYPFLPGMMASFADYFGMALLTPALPYFLGEELGLDEKGVSVWTGAVTTAQYAGGTLGNLMVGVLGDRLGSRATLGLTLCGDVVLFSLTAFSRQTAMLVAVRFLAGLSSPLVPALLYILERARDKMHALEGVNAYSMSVNLGYCFGGIIVGVGYEDMRWVGLNLFSAVVAGVAFVCVLYFYTPVGGKGGGGGADGAGRAGERVRKKTGAVVAAAESAGDDDEEKGAGGGGGSTEDNAGGGDGDGDGVRGGGGGGGGGGGDGGRCGGEGGGGGGRKEVSSTSFSAAAAFRSGAMVSHCYTAFAVGYQFLGFLVLFVLMAKQVLRWSATIIGWSFIAIPVANTVTMYLFIPPLVRSVGVHGLITYSSVCFGVVLGAFALPAVHTSPSGVMIVTFCLIICIVMVQVPNQTRIKTIADTYAPGNMGSITGASRVCFAGGQTVSPIVCAVLYVRSPSLAIVSMLVVAMMIPVVFLLTGTPMFVDPPTPVQSITRSPLSSSSSSFDSSFTSHGTNGIDPPGKLSQSKVPKNASGD